MQIVAHPLLERDLIDIATHIFTVTQDASAVRRRIIEARELLQDVTENPLFGAPLAEDLQGWRVRHGGCGMAGAGGCCRWSIALMPTRIGLTSPWWPLPDRTGRPSQRSGDAIFPQSDRACSNENRAGFPALFPLRRLPPSGP